MNEIYESLKKEGLSPNATYGLSRLFAFMTEGKELPDKVRKRWREIGIIEPDGSVVVDKPLATGNGMAWLLLGIAYEGKMTVKWDKKKGLTYSMSKKGRRYVEKLGAKS